MKIQNPFECLVQEMENHLRALDTIWNRICLDEKADKVGSLACISWMLLLIRQAEGNIDALRSFSNDYKHFKEDK